MQDYGKELLAIDPPAEFDVLSLPGGWGHVVGAPVCSQHVFAEGPGLALAARNVGCLWTPTSGPRAP